MADNLKAILKALENNARATTKQISTMTGIPEAEVISLTRKAEKDQTIIKYKTIINWEKIQEDEEEVWALIEVNVTPQRDVGFESVAKRIYRFPQTRTVYLLSGTYDLLLVVTGKSIQEIAKFVSQKLAPTDGVEGTTTHFMLERYKEDGEILKGEEKAKRQPLTP